MSRMISGMLGLKQALAHVFPMDPSCGALVDLWVCACPRVCVSVCISCQAAVAIASHANC